MHFERLKPHYGGPTEWATVPTNNSDVKETMDPEPEESLLEKSDEASQPAYREEVPSDATLPSRQRHWMDTRLRTRMRAGGSRRFYQQFGSSTDTDEESSNILLPSAQVETN